MSFCLLILNIVISGVKQFTMKTFMYEQKH